VTKVVFTSPPVVIAPDKDPPMVTYNIGDAKKTVNFPTKFLLTPTPDVMAVTYRCNMINWISTAAAFNTGTQPVATGALETPWMNCDFVNNRFEVETNDRSKDGDYGIQVTVIFNDLNATENKEWLFILRVSDPCEV